MNIEILQPKTKSDITAYLNLRWQLLRKPWNQPKGTEIDKFEDEAIKVMAKHKTKIVGVGRIHKVENNIWQIRYMAVIPEYQGKQVGKKILLELEYLAKRQNAKEIFLNSRETAVDFYKKNGYEIESEGKTLFDSIKHFKMKKIIFKDTK